MKIILFISGGVLVLLTSCKKKKEEIVTPVFSAITEVVFAPGHIEADDQFTLMAMNDGYIKEVLVKEGDIVNKSQILFVQDNTAAVVQQQTATQSLLISEQQAASNSAVLQQLQVQLNAADDKLLNDRTQLDRMRRLSATNSVAKIDLDNAQLSYDNSLSNVKSIQQNIDATKLSLEQGVVNSRGQQQIATVNSSYFNIKSPGSYKIYSVLKRKGELVRKGEAVALLGSAENLKVVLSIDEVSIAKIQLQQKVLIELNTEKNKVFTGYISKIYPAFDVNSQTYTVEADFDTITTSVINGTLLQANIIVAKKDRSMLIPRGCLTANGKVLLKKEHSADTAVIQTGIISNDWVEVLSGLNISDKIIRQF